MATLNLAINAAGAAAGAVNFQNATISVQNSAKAAGAAVAGAERSIHSFGSTLSHVFAAAGIATGIHDIVSTFINFDSGIVRVGKSSGISGDQLKYLGDQFIAMSTRIPQSTDELLKIGYAAGQLGVHGSENILKFTETIAKLSVTGNLAGEQAAKSLARILNVTKEGMGSVDKLASTIVQVAHGGNGMKGSAATEAEIAGTTVKIAQAGSPFGMKSADAVALAASFASIGVPAQIAATSTSKVLQVFDQAARSGDTLHSKLGELAQVSGTTAEEFQGLIKKDPTMAFAKFIQGLGQVGQAGGNTKQILNDLGLVDERMLKSILPLAKSANDLAGKLKLARDEFANPQRLALEAEKQFNTFGAQLTILKNSFEAFFLMQRDGASPLLGFLKNLNEALQIMLGFKDATESTTPAVKYMVDAIETFVTILEVWAGLKMAQLIQDMMVSVLGLGEGIAKAGILTNPLLTAVLAIGVALGSWSIGKTLMDRFQWLRDTTANIIELMGKAALILNGPDKAVATEIANRMGKSMALGWPLEGAARGQAESVLSYNAYIGRRDPKTHEYTAADQAIVDRVTQNFIEGYKQFQNGQVGASNLFDIKSELVRQMADSVRPAPPPEEAAKGFIGNFTDAVTQIKKNFGDLFNMGDLTKAVKQLHKDEEPAKTGQGDFTPEELEGFSNEKNSLAVMLAELKLEGDYLKQNNQEQKISETLAKARTKSEKEDIDNRDELLQQIAEQIRLNATEKASRDINKQLDQQQQMVNLMKLTDDAREVETQYLQLTNKYQEEGINFSESYLAGVHAQIKAMQQQKQEAETIQNIAHGIGDAFGNAFETAIMGAKSFGEVMKSLIQDIEKTLIHEMITKQLVKGVTGLVSGAFGGGGATAQVGDYGGEAGPAYVTPHALGDIFSSPTYFNYGGSKHVAGEGGGSEAIMPLGRDSQGRLGVRGGGGGRGDITIIVNSPNADSFRKSMPQTAAAARRAMGGR